MYVDKSEMEFQVQPHLGVSRGEVAERVLIPGDPDRAKIISDFLSERKPIGGRRCFNGFTGRYKDREISVMPTHMGGPSAAIAVEELIRAGAKYLIRVGTCGAVQKDVEVGDLIIALSAVPDDGTSRSYVNFEPFCPTASFKVVNAIIKAAELEKVRYHVGVVRSSDAFYAEDPDTIKKWERRGILAFEMEDAAIFTVAMLRGINAGAIHLVNGNLVRGVQFAPEDELKGHLEKAIRVALEAACMLS
ncbi:MAG: nucleoside phosphorylase [Candidatus Methanodesulfokora sp.]